HVRHRRVVVGLGIVLLLFLEDRENAAGCIVALRAGAHSGPADEDTVAVNVHRLLRDAHQHHERTARRDFWIPPIFARLKRTTGFAGGSAFGVSGGLFNRVGGSEQGGGDGEGCEELHNEDTWMVGGNW